MAIQSGFGKEAGEPLRTNEGKKGKNDECGNIGYACADCAGHRSVDCMGGIVEQLNEL